MSNSCKMPLKAYIQCIRATECFQRDPCDARMSQCSKDPEAEEKCSSAYNNYVQCKQGTMDMMQRMRGNKALRS